MSKSNSNKAPRSEEQIPLAIDKCIADGIIKTGSGLVTGAVISFALFRRRLWPLTLGIGIGAGMALANCQDNINSTDVVKRNLNSK